MATTRIMPLHVGKGRTESRAISDIIDYVANPQRSICWWTFRQNCRLEKVLAIRDGLKFLI